MAAQKRSTYMGLVMVFVTRLGLLILSLSEIIAFSCSPVPRQHACAGIGQNVTLRCHTTWDYFVDWHWRDPNDTNQVDIYIYNNGKVQLPYQQRFSVDKPVKGDYNLIITDVQLSDSGLYTCVEHDGYGQPYKITLTVIPELDSAADAAVSELSSDLSSSTTTSRTIGTTASHSSRNFGIIIGIVTIIIIIIICAAMVVICVLKFQIDYRHRKGCYERTRWYGAVDNLQRCLRHVDENCDKTTTGSNADIGDVVMESILVSSSPAAHVITGTQNVQVLVHATSLRPWRSPLTASIQGTEVNSISLSWSDCHDESITRYVIQYRACREGGDDVISIDWMEDKFTYSDRETSRTVYELLPGTKYELRVLAVHEDELHCEPSNVVVATTQTRQTSLPPPHKVVICNDVTAGLNTITLRWSASSEKLITMYFVQYRQYRGDYGCENPQNGNTTTWLEQHCSAANTNPCVIHELMPDTKYELRVVAVNADGVYSEPSDIVRARTQTVREFWKTRDRRQ